MAEGIQNGIFRRNNTAPPADNGVMSLFSLAGKTAIISGAGGGIGLAAAKAFAEAGANVAIWYNTNDEAVNKAASIENAFNVKCRAYQVDVTSPEEVEAVIQKVIMEFGGRLDIFVANSGTSWGDETFIDADIKRYHDLMKINVDGVVYCARAAGKHFRRQKKEGTTADGTKLDNFSSGSFIATASKSLAIEWLGFARVNSVSPGYVNTGLSGAVPEEVMDSIRDKIPMGRFGETVEMQGIYLYLASDASSYATGADFIVDGGYTAP
ncbi:hypothetical protein ACHAQJ_008794 [Trichoderma viride]